MPFWMSDYIQSVVVEGTAYIGGGYTGKIEEDNIVMIYDICSGKSSTLPPYRECYFAMTAISGKLVLVGGKNCSSVRSKVLGVWDGDEKQWTHPYPEMPTARSSCSVIVYNEWLVVAGGLTSTSTGVASAVEVMNINSKTWYDGPQTCVPWYWMKTALVGDECFFMGGYTRINAFSAVATTKVYCMSLLNLVSNLHSDEREGQLWNVIPGLQVAHSTPLSISGSLLTVGGRDKDHNAMTAIHLYQTGAGEWMKIGDLPTPRFNCTCTLLNPNREVLVAGGHDCDNVRLNSIAIAKIHKFTSVIT